jgi:hypothetical protein
VNGRVEQRRFEVFLVEEGDALRRIGSTVGDVIHVAALG